MQENRCTESCRTLRNEVSNVSVEQRYKFVAPNGVDFAAEIHDSILQNFRKGQTAKLGLPNLFNRAFLVFHEAGIIPMIDSVENEEEA